MMDTSTLTPIDRVGERLEARQAGPGRFVARCPSHRDHSPSLSISAGRDGRILLRCHAGCSLTAILAASGLAMRDLFAGPPPTAAQLAAAERERTRADSLRRARGVEERVWCDALREGWRERDSAVRRVGRKLMLMSDHDTGSAGLTVYFHDLVEERRTFDRAIVGDPLDWLPMEKPVPPPCSRNYPLHGQNPPRVDPREHWSVTHVADVALPTDKKERRG
jgi:hypothetical protein